jgi:ATP-binding cassette subfamily B protein
MIPVFEYVHVIEGRLRVKVPEVKRSKAFARAVEDLFRSVEGIHEVRANPLTGNVLFLHDPKRIPVREILAGLVAAGYMGMGIAEGQNRPRIEPLSDVAATIAELVAWGLSRALGHFTTGPGWLEQLVEAATRFLVKLVFGQVATALV